MAMAMEEKELEKEETQKVDKKLAEDLLATGNALLSPPSSVEQLFPLLEKLENLLLGLKQSPANSLQMALNPAMKALTTKEFLNHLHLDVKVCVASCISEILRITAPEAPYSDELMKEVFKLIVAAFDNISDISSHLYKKRVSILETFTKVRLWVLMLDLECDLLILEMFDNFLRNIRESHPDVVFMSMGFIMIMVLEGIEEIPSELLSSLLGSARKGNQNVLPIARKLAERVIENCGLKLAPYMHKAVQFAGFPLDNYGKIVAYICAQNSETLELGVLASQDNSTKKDPPKKKRGSSSVDQSSKLGHIDSQHDRNVMEVSNQTVRENEYKLSAMKRTGKILRGNDKRNYRKNLNRHFSYKKMIQSAKCNTQSSVNKNTAMVRSPIKKSMMKDTPRIKWICVAPDNNKNFGEDLFRSRIRVPCSNEQMQEQKKPEINPCSVAGKTMKEGTPIREFDAEVPESGIDCPRSVENVSKSENKTLKDMVNTEQNSAVESKDGSDRSCSESEESAFSAAIKLKDDSLEPRTTEDQEPPKMAFEECKYENGLTKNMVTKLMLLKDWVPPKLKKLRTPRRAKDQPIIQDQDDLEQEEQNGSRKVSGEVI